jgi:hypothetical protein
MSTISSTPSDRPPAAVNTRSTNDGSPASAAAQGRFEQALNRVSERQRGPARNETSQHHRADDDSDDESPDNALPANAAPPTPRSGDAPSAEELAAIGGLGAWVSSSTPQWVGSLDAAGPAASGLAMEQFAAALNRLQAPVNTNGVQQWQFGLADGHSPVVNVQLQATAAGPWKVSLQGQARDRGVLHAQLDKLRTRLESKGARIGELLIDDADPPA